MNNHEQIEERVTLLSLFKNRNYILILLSSTFTGFAFSIFLLAETWYVVDELNNQAALGLVLAATSLPRVLFMVFGGAYADRLKGSVLMLLSNFIRSVLIAKMDILIIFGLLDVLTLILFALLFGVLDAFYWPANNTIVPALIPKEQLTRANSFLELSFRLTFISGPLIAGLLLTLGSFELVFGTVVVLLLVGAICILPLLGFETEKTRAKTTIFRELRDSFQYASKSQFLIGAMTISIMTNLIITGPGTMHRRLL
ncbi:MFS transporter [Geomicrobium sp. JCM 19038]|uniref:MFS transporter n=1 Tax=Geomicrobium sp. JCM 19038 TaxID=1460635 RepID=UPI0005A824DD|nr:MFS transporter [Geomicrobium sp. JCM 19038]